MPRDASHSQTSGLQSSPYQRQPAAASLTCSPPPPAPARPRPYLVTWGKRKGTLLSELGTWHVRHIIRTRFWVGIPELTEALIDHGYMNPDGSYGPEKPAKATPRQKWVDPPLDWEPVWGADWEEAGVSPYNLVSARKANMEYKVKERPLYTYLEPCPQTETNFDRFYEWQVQALAEAGGLVWEPSGWEKIVEARKLYGKALRES